MVFAHLLQWFALSSVFSIARCLSFTSLHTDYLRSGARHGHRSIWHNSRLSVGSLNLPRSTRTIRASVIRLGTRTADDNDDHIDRGGETTTGDSSIGLYIHIPYCRQRCRYCDFAIVPIGDKKLETSSNGNDKGRREQGFLRMNERYVSAIVAELKHIANIKSDGHKIPLRSVYFGGGTPSLAPIESIAKILYHACGPDNPEAPFRLVQQEQEHDSNDRTGGNVATTEITMEMDPGTFDRDHLSSLRALGINRISLGVQSFDDDILTAMGRTHRRADILQAIQDITFVYGKEKYGTTDYDKVNYSIDLISGCPGLTPAKWAETLEEATTGVHMKKTITNNEQTPLLLSSLPAPKHISVYDMQIEDGTVFGKWAAKAKAEAAAKRETSDPEAGLDEDEDDDDISRQFTVALPIEGPNQGGKQRILRLPTEDECGFMYKYAAGYLRAKRYEHYEVSSYAAFEDKEKDQPIHDKHENSTEQSTRCTSKRSRHNQIYWEYNGQWHAVGLGATSFVNKKMLARPREMSDYLDWVKKLKDSDMPNANKEEHIKEHEGDPDEDFLTDLLLKRLRTIDGLDLAWLESHYGSEVVRDVLGGAQLGLELGLAERTEENVLRLTDPDGLLYSNFIISSIFAELGFTA